MRLLRLAAVGAIGIAAWRALTGRKRRTNAAFSRGQGAPGNATQIRDAGPEAMRDRPRRPWSEVDENSDESFPASDPPGNY
jgi:hypothetical protein